MKRGMLPFPDWYVRGVATVLEHLYPELTGRRSLYDLVVSDLHRAGLVDIDTCYGTAAPNMGGLAGSPPRCSHLPRLPIKARNNWPVGCISR